jgi:ADP-dependent phosphofructokinase/glucokinase
VTGSPTGDVMAIDSAVMAQWMEDHFHGPLQLGGTGAQAANTLARLGYPSLLHVTHLSAVDATVFSDAARIAVATPQGLRPLPEAIRAADRPMVHYVFEYQTGDRLCVAGQCVTAARANRIIMGYDPINATLPIDPLFMQAIAAPRSRVSRVLISGFTDLESVEVARARIAETIAYLRDLRRTRPELLVHLELASVTDGALLRPILDELASHADSLGLNEQEVGLVAAAWGWPIPHPQSVEERLETLFRIRDRLRLRRVNMHTQDYCLTLTDLDPRAERNSLLFASLVAGTRARLGRFPTPADLRQTLDGGVPAEAGLAAEARLAGQAGLAEGIGAYYGIPLVFVPTLSVSHPAGTVGLGDSFTAGILVFLDGTRPQ